MRYSIRTCLAVLATALVMSACGSATSDGSRSPSAEADISFSNPTAGLLPTYATIEELTTALSPDCRWVIQHNDTSTPDSAWCEPESLDVALSRDGDVMTVERVATFLGEPNEVCEWWGMLVLGYSLTRTGGSELYSAAGVTPTDLPEVTSSVETPAGIVYGGNWWTTYGTATDGQRLSGATGGFLIPAPSGCSSESAAPATSSAAQPTDCSSGSIEFLEALVTHGLSGVSVETVEGLGPRMMDSATCMSDYIALADAASVESALTAYLTSLGYTLAQDLTKADYITIVVGTAEDRPRVELQLPVAAEGSSDHTPFEVLVADG